jgi:exodeoxyribonuclease V alpha subunit
MLVAFQGRVVSVRQLTVTGFSEAIIEGKDGPQESLGFEDRQGGRKVVGKDLVMLKRGDDVVVVGIDEVKPKFGPQIRVLHWWYKARCPFNDVKVACDTIAFLRDDLKLTPSLAENIFEAYLHETMAVIRDNPYRLVTEGRVKRIGLTTIDKMIAPHFQIAPSDRRRLKAQIVEALKLGRGMRGIPPYFDEMGVPVYGLKGGGHTYSLFSHVVGYSAESMDLDRKTVSNEVRRLAMEPRSPLDKRPLIVIESNEEGKETFIYSQTLHAAEKGLAYHVDRVMRSNVLDLSKIDIVSPGLTLSEEQEAAVRMALRESLSIITGGPGVGKTTIIRALVHTFISNDIDFSLCALAGVAARRMVKATDQPASTIHKLLVVDPIAGRFQHYRGNPLASSAIICDESSMVDIGLMYSLFDAVKTGARVILVGDADQLPPVGAGAPFKDLVSWGKIPIARLTSIRRQELADSLIIKGSRNILEKKMPEFSKDTSGDLFAFSYTSEQGALKTIAELVLTKIKERFGIDRDGIQVLCPHKRVKRTENKETGEVTESKLLSAESVNLFLQEKIHQQKPPQGQKFFVGDRVIHTRNNYNLDVMNGEIGYVREARVKKHKESMKVEYMVEYPDRKVLYSSNEDIYQLELAYAMSVHKSQGSEFQAAIVIAYSSGEFFSRNMLYTAITRGKRVVIVVSPKGGSSFSKILKTDETKRASRLIWRIENQSVTTDEELEELDLDDLNSGDDA